MVEGLLPITVVATDDDGTTTTIVSEIDVLNVAPTVGPPQLWKGGEEMLLTKTARGIDEDEVALLKTTASDTTNDQGTMIVEWHPSTENENWTITSQGVSSSEAVSWNTSGLHTVQGRAIDADGASSDIKQGTVMVHNVPPSVTGLPGNTPVYEDEQLDLSVTASDTSSDQESLVVCISMPPLTSMQTGSTTARQAEPLLNHLGQPSVSEKSPSP